MNFASPSRSAFLYHWNLLAFLGGMGFAALTGHPDVFCAAGPGGRGRLPRPARDPPQVPEVRRSPRRPRRSASRERPAPSSDAQRILRALPEKLVKRFESLRSRCLELRQIALELKEPAAARVVPAAGGAPTGRARPAALDLPAPAVHPAHARALLPADERGPDPRRHQGPRAAAQADGRGTGRPAEAEAAEGLEDNLETCRRGWRTSRRPATTASWSRSRSTAWRTRSARSASWRSTARSPTSSRARSTRWSSAWSRRSGP